jgi:choline dehydrogenase-like flavoprotein
MKGAHHAYHAGKREEAELDVIVVGSGAGGATAAVKLARAGLRVGIVEAGAWRAPQDYPSSAYGSMRDLMDAWGATMATGRAFWPIVQARCVGGTTVINSAICVRTPADVFARWERETGISAKDMGSRIWAHEDALATELSVSDSGQVVGLGRSSRLAMKGATALGVPSEHTHRYAKDCAGSGQCLQGCHEGKKQSLNVTFVPEVLERGGEVYSCAPVSDVIFEGKRAVGVRGRYLHPQTREKGAHFTLRAKLGVVVAASVTKSCELLRRSGVKNKMLGEGFRSHPGTGVFGVYDEPVDMNLGTTQGWASIAYRDNPGLKLETLSIPPELVASRLSGGGLELMERLSEYRHLAMWCHAVRAESVGRISHGLLGTQIHYTLDKADMERFRRGMWLLAQMHVAAGAKAVIPGIAGFSFKLEANEIDQLLDAPLDPRHYVAVLSHLFGGCVMGSDPRRSVVDGSGRVHGYEGLVVADASVIPTNLGVNPQHTIMGLASVFADDFAART